MYRYLLALFILFSLLLANGLVNVFTGDPAAEIFIDGDSVGKEQVLKKSLSEGTHYIQIKKSGKTVGSKTIEITTDKLETVVIDNFVDFKTNVASRGAIDVEAMRVRETRGNVAFGIHGGSPATGLSIAWWPWEKVGFEGIGYVNNFQGNVDSRGGGRILFDFNDSVYNNSSLTYYGAIGVGKARLTNKDDSERNEAYDITEGSLGVEFKIFDLFAKSQPAIEQIIVHSGDRERASTENNSIDAALELLKFQLILGLGYGLLSVSHFNLEIGVERVATQYYRDTRPKTYDERVSGKVSGGCRVYF